MIIRSKYMKLIHISCLFEQEMATSYRHLPLEIKTEIWSHIDPDNIDLYTLDKETSSIISNLNSDAKYKLIEKCIYTGKGHLLPSLLDAKVISKLQPKDAYIFSYVAVNGYINIVRALLNKLIWKHSIYLEAFIDTMMNGNNEIAILIYEALHISQQRELNIRGFKDIFDAAISCDNYIILEYLYNTSGQHSTNRQLENAVYRSYATFKIVLTNYNDTPHISIYHKVISLDDTNLLALLLSDGRIKPNHYEYQDIIASNKFDILILLAKYSGVSTPEYVFAYLANGISITSNVERFNVIRELLKYPFATHHLPGKLLEVAIDYGHYDIVDMYLKRVNISTMHIHEDIDKLDTQYREVILARYDMLQHV